MIQHTLMWDPDLQAVGDLAVQKAAPTPGDLEFFAVTFRGVPVCPHRTERMRLTNGTAAQWRKAAAVSRQIWGDLTPGVDAATHQAATKRRLVLAEVPPAPKNE